MKDPEVGAGDGTSFEIDEPAVHRLVTGGKADRLVFEVIAHAEAGGGRDDRDARPRVPWPSRPVPDRRRMSPRTGLRRLRSF